MATPALLLVLACNAPMPGDAIPTVPPNDPAHGAAEIPQAGSTAPPAEKPPPIDWRIPGDEQPLGYPVDVYTRSIAFSLHYRAESVPTPVMEVIQPDGSPYSGDIVDGGEVLHGRTPFATRFLDVDDPAPGYWRVLVNGAEQIDGDDIELSCTSMSTTG